MRCVVRWTVPFLALGLCGCGSLLYDATLASHMTVDPNRADATTDVHAFLMSVLDEEGYQVTLADRQAGMITTDFREVAVPRSLWPFEYRLRVHVRLRRADGELRMTLTPTVRGVHRVVRSRSRDYPVLELGATEGHVASARRDEASALDAAAAEYHRLVDRIAEGLGVPASEIGQETARYRRANLSNPLPFP